jgi:peptidoglycan/xylan/chitin deacetylase (PgdA/CDA1 family)
VARSGSEGARRLAPGLGPRGGAHRDPALASSMVRTHALMYHDVVDGDPDQSGFVDAGSARYKLSGARFKAHLDALSETLSDKPGVVDDLLAGDSSRAVWLLTFDDGGASALATGEELARRKWPGHFFITTGLIGQRGFLDASAIIELRTMGHIIGSHSASHPSRMSSLPDVELGEEWRASVESLADLLGEEIRSASVPGGYYAKRVARAAAEAGIAALFTSEPVRTTQLVGQCLVVGRLAMKTSTSAVDASRIAAGDSAPWFQEWVGWNVRKPAKAVLGKGYERLRGGVLSHRAEVESH